MPLDLFALARALIDIDSTTGRERAVADFLARYLGELAAGTGGRVERIPVEGERENLFASWGEPRVVLSTHMDTVPPFFPSREDEEYVHGRGACDAKGAIAAMLAAIERLLAEGGSGFGLLLVVGEETDSLGAMIADQWANERAGEHARGARYLIDGEPTENRLALGSKGVLYLEIEVAGRAAHSAYPELGISAIDRLLDTLARLRAVPLPADPVLGETTLNIGVVEGGRAANVIADRARAEVLVRTVADTTELKEALLAAVAAVEGVRVARLRETPAVRLGALPGFETTVVKFTTDVPRLTRWGEPYLLGPGSIHVAHTPEERVGKAELMQAVGLYAELVRRLR
jgi:acetylornithine deacetylase